MEVLLLQQLAWREDVRTLTFAEDGLFGFFIQVALFGRLLDDMFVVRQFALLYGWVSVEVGFGASLPPPL